MGSSWEDNTLNFYLLSIPGILAIVKTLLADLKLLSSLTVISLLLAVFDGIGLLHFPKSLAQMVTVPVQYGLYKSAMSLGKQLEFITTARFAALENHALREQMGNLLVENSNLRARLAENETLADQYNKLSPTTYDLLPARVVGSGRNLTLDKGLDNGIKVGQVVVFKDTYVGQINRVNPRSSQVILPSDPDSKVAVYSQGEGGRAKGILEGQFGSELLMNKILHQESINVGDLVYSEGTEEKIPKGLIMGKVLEVFDKQNDVFKQAKIIPLFNAVNLDVVFVIRSS